MKTILFSVLLLIATAIVVQANPPDDVQRKRVACVKINRCLVWNRVTDQTKCVPRRVSQGKTYCQKWNSSKYTVFSH